MDSSEYTKEEQRRLEPADAARIKNSYLEEKSTISLKPGDVSETELIALTESQAADITAAAQVRPLRKEPDLAELADKREQAVQAAIAQVHGYLHFCFWIVAGAAVLWVFFLAMHGLKDFLGTLPPLDGTTSTSPWNQPANANDLLSTLGLQHLNKIGDVLKLMPFAVVGCVLTSYGVGLVAARSRSRSIDWTDSHLILELSGPVALTFRWSAIASVEQKWQWELFHGKQPVFVVTTKEGNKFRLRLSDISYKHNVGEFFSLIKTNAPAAVLSVDRSFASDNSYTELWLKYFSSPAERKKTGLLTEGMLIDNGHYEIVGTIGGGGQGTAYLARINDSNFFFLNPEHNQATTSKDDGDESRSADKDEIKKRNLAHSEHIMKPDRHRLEKMKTVVLKEYVLPIHRGHLTAERTAEKLKAEAEILQQLEHPQIVSLLDAFIEDYRGYLVLDYVEGQPLKELVDTTGPQQIATVINWSLQVCAILRYLHGLTPPIVHRDITPDNLLLQNDGTVKIVDFNVAYQVDSSATATVVGKHAFIPAEQFRGKPTPQSDIYALGATMFYLLTGEEPEPITESHPARVNAAVPQELDAIIARATANDLSRRYQNADELSQALGALIK